MLSIEDLTVKVNDKEIVKELNLEIEKSKSLALLGQNGSGKSTLAKFIAGYPKYELVKGAVYFKTDDYKTDLFQLQAEERAKNGVFLIHQQNFDLPGIPPISYLRTILNTHLDFQGKKEISSKEFLDLLKNIVDDYGFDSKLYSRPFLEGFSGGERKMFELLQMIVLQPKLVILDEVDSGLDVDARQNVAKIVEKLKSLGTTFLIISHSPEFLDLLSIDKAVVMESGKIVEQSGAELIQKVASSGFTD